MSFTYRLTYPPSANSMYRAVRGSVIKSKAYRAWFDAVRFEHKPPMDKALSGRYQIHLIATPPDRRRRDLDNLIKPVLDALTELRLTPDDQHCRKIMAEWAEPSKNAAGITVHCREFEE